MCVKERGGGKKDRAKPNTVNGARRKRGREMDEGGWVMGSIFVKPSEYHVSCRGQLLSL